MSEEKKTSPVKELDRRFKKAEEKLSKVEGEVLEHDKDYSENFSSLEQLITKGSEIQTNTDSMVKQDKPLVKLLGLKTQYINCKNELEGKNKRKGLIKKFSSLEEFSKKINTESRTKKKQMRTENAIKNILSKIETYKENIKNQLENVQNKIDNLDGLHKEYKKIEQDKKLIMRVEESYNKIIWENSDNIEQTNKIVKELEGLLLDLKKVNSSTFAENKKQWREKIKELLEKRKKLLIGQEKALLINMENDIDMMKNNLQSSQDKVTTRISNVKTIISTLDKVMSKESQEQKQKLNNKAEKLLEQLEVLLAEKAKKNENLLEEIKKEIKDSKLGENFDLENVESSIRKKEIILYQLGRIIVQGKEKEVKELIEKVKLQLRILKFLKAHLIGLPSRSPMTNDNKLSTETPSKNPSEEKEKEKKEEEEEEVKIEVVEELDEGGVNSKPDDYFEKVINRWIIESLDKVTTKLDGLSTDPLVKNKREPFSEAKSQIAKVIEEHKNNVYNEVYLYLLKNKTEEKRNDIFIAGSFTGGPFKNEKVSQEDFDIFWRELKEDRIKALKRIRGALEQTVLKGENYESFKTHRNISGKLGKKFAMALNKLLDTQVVGGIYRFFAGKEPGHLTWRPNSQKQADSIEKRVENIEYGTIKPIDLRP